MSNAVLISIHPRWCEPIANGKKKIEVRKTRPKIETPFKCLIYCTKPKYRHEDFICIGAGTENARAFYGGGKIIGEFVCDKITDLRDMGGEEFFSKSCMTYDDWRNYTDYTKHIIYGWNISDLVIYDKPKELSEFKRRVSYGSWSRIEKITRPPQSWCYVEVSR